ncbi:MAG: hypothetical protein SVT52_07875 [Planctomycetota bacterium]|nr:hypothetical protein [Planctomycetota bacterium]
MARHRQAIGHSRLHLVIRDQEHDECAATHITADPLGGQAASVWPGVSYAFASLRF